MTRSTRANELLDRAEKDGIVKALSNYGANLKVSIPIEAELWDISIEILNLSARSQNGLMRAGLTTVGKVCEKIAEERGLSQLRNVGRKSISEIKTAIVAEAYKRLSYADRNIFWKRFLEENMIE